MIEALFAGLPLADHHGDALRNIVSLRRSEDLFDDLSDDPSARQVAMAAELASKPGTQTSTLPAIDRPFEEAAWDAAIGYPFRHWMASRYSDGSFGVWYGATALETTIFETVHHWRSGLLADAGFDRPGVSIERRVYRVRCDAALIDMRSAVARYPALVHPDDYALTHQLGARMHREGHPGLISRSARCTGDVLAVLNPAVLSSARHHCYLTYTLTSNGVRVERSLGRTLLRIPTGKG